MLHNNEFDIKWYLPKLENDRIYHIPINFQDSTQDDNNMTDEMYLVGLIADFYYTEGAKNIFFDKNIEEDQKYKNIKKLNQLDKIHKNLMLCKRIFFHGLNFLQKCTNNTKERVNSQKWNNKKKNFKKFF